MTKATGSEAAWAMIEREKERDRIIRRVSVIAWSVTAAMVLVFAVLTIVRVAEMWKIGQITGMPWTAAITFAMPLVIVVGLLSVLIATLTTVGIFLRLRTASLAEIQLRLAALEDMLASRPDTAT